MSPSSLLRIRWAAIGAAVAISLGAGSIGVVNAVQSSGERSTYTAIPACRVTDTRSNPEFNTGPKNTPLGSGQTMTVKATGNNGDCTGIPTDVTGVSLNVTTLHATRDTHITIWPDGLVPDASSLNPAPGQPPAPNAVTTKVAADGTFKVFNHQGSVNVVIDIVGFFRDHNHDDRYYSKQQIDSQLAASTPLLESTPAGGDGLLSPDTEVVRSVPITTSGQGQVIVTASGWSESLATGISDARCALTLSPLVPSPSTPVGDDGFTIRYTGNGSQTPYSTTKVFQVTGRSPATARLLCVETGGNIGMKDNTIHAMFVRD